MKIVGRKSLEEFIFRHAELRAQADAWLYEAEEAEWQFPDEIKARYAHSSFLANNVVIFNLKGNKYRLATKISYRNKIVSIINVGTHAEYSKWDFREGKSD